MTPNEHTEKHCERIRVLLVDDHEAIRQQLKALLEEHADVEVVGEGQNGEEAVTLSSTVRPSVVIMDINMPVMNGIEATKRIKLRSPTLPIIALSVNDDSYGAVMLKAGAIAFLRKSSAAELLYPAILQALREDMAMVISSRSSGQIPN